MKFKLKATPLALAAAAAFALPSASAWAWDDYTADAHVGSDVNISTDVNLAPDVAIPQLLGGAAATIKDDQNSNHNYVSNNGDPNAATAKGDAGSNTTGNIGINISAGDNNVQSNEGALAAADASQVFGGAQIFVDQRARKNQTTNSEDTANNAILQGNALYKATGNIGVNIAAGDSNVQKNAMAMATASTNDLALASVAQNQKVSWNCTTNDPSVQNNATLQDEVLNGASGNIGANVTAGTNNLQSNLLSVVATSTPSGAATGD